MFSVALIVLFCVFAYVWKQYLLLFTAGWILGPPARSRYF